MINFRSSMNDLKKILAKAAADSKNPQADDESKANNCTDQTIQQ